MSTGRAIPARPGLAAGHGLADVHAGQLVAVGDGMAVAAQLRHDRTDLLLFDPLHRPAPAHPLPHRLQLPVALTGRIVDPLGRALDGALLLPSPVVDDGLTGDRSPWTHPRTLHTGVKVIDLFLPILQGTCCLLTGPPHSGRRTLLHRILRGHIADGGRSILVIPALTATMRPRLAALLSAGATVIAAPWGAPPTLRARALRTGAVVAAAWRDAGAEVLLAVDDLPAHFQAEAEVAALLERPLYDGGRALSSDADLSLILSQACRRRTGSLTLLLHSDQDLPALHPAMHLHTSARLARQGRFPALDVFRDHVGYFDPGRFDGRHIPLLMKGHLGATRLRTNIGWHDRQNEYWDVPRWNDPVLVEESRLIEAFFVQPADVIRSREEQIALLRGLLLASERLRPAQLAAWEDHLIDRMPAAPHFDLRSINRRGQKRLDDTPLVGFLRTVNDAFFG